jgi:protein TonB
MAFDYRPADTSRRYRGLAAAIAVHVLLGWLLISGTARKGFEMLNKPLQAVVIQDVVIAPPPPPPPPKLVVPPKPQTTPTQPPPFIPVAEVPLVAPTTFAVEATPVVHEAPPPAPAPVVVAAPPAPAPAPAPAPKVDMAIVCPTQVTPEMPRRASIDGTQGIVKAQVRIVDGAVREVTFLSGPRIFYAAVRSAMLQYKCSRESGEVVATQDFNFKLQP